MYSTTSIVIGIVIAILAVAIIYTLSKRAKSYYSGHGGKHTHAKATVTRQEFSINQPEEESVVIGAYYNTLNTDSKNGFSEQQIDALAIRRCGYNDCRESTLRNLFIQGRVVYTSTAAGVLHVAVYVSGQATDALEKKAEIAFALPLPENGSEPVKFAEKSLDAVCVPKGGSYTILHWIESEDANATITNLIASGSYVRVV